MRLRYQLDRLEPETFVTSFALQVELQTELI